MANAFNLTAQLQLQAPTNTSQVANQISKDLNGITVDVQVKANPRQMAAANSQMQGLSKATQQSANNMGNLNRSLSEAARRFSVITIATGSLLALSRSIKNAFGEAIQFERQLIKIEQVTGRSVKNLSGLTKEITKLSTSLGASSKDLLGISRILTQAGFEVTKVKAALDILAKTTLGATFEDIEDTTEGAVAALRQFGDEAKRVGGDIKFLEKTMDAINSVSKNFAVESGDLITVIRRVGGVFESAGGSVNELIALFTSVRSTTRETAETISTGLRTIFTRLQRTDTVDQLKELGIQLRDSKGQFVGAYEAINRLSVGLADLNPKDFRFSEIVESLGGFRQIGKVIPLIKQFTVAQDALRVAQQSSGSVARDAATAQQSLSVQFDKTKEKFDALVRNLADSTSFQTMARLVLKLADAFTRMVDALEPLLPLLLPLMGLKLGRALAPGIAALAGASRFTRKNEGGPIRKFATGGVVPGTGNRDTVPAMLTPGEFVIRKGSVKKLGAETLAQMNNNRYAKGGVAGFKSAFARKNMYKGRKKLSKGADEPFQSEVNQFTKRDTVEASIARKSLDVSNEIKKAYRAKDKQLRFARRFNSQKSNPKIQGETFERLLRKSKTLGGSDSVYGGSAPLDGIYGSRLAEVKRSSVSENVLLDKRLRHEQDRNKLKGQTLTSRGADNISLTGLTELSAASKSVTLKQFQNKNAGGAIKSILQTNNVGSATLNLGDDSNLPLGKILNSEVTNSRYLKGNNFAQNNSAVSKYLKSKGKGNIPSYTLKRASLNKKTSDKFTGELLNQIGSAVDGASQALGMDLIGKSVSASDSAKTAIRSKFASEGGVVGDLFEATLNTIANSGGFAPANIQQPFDFPNGLTGPASDNFTGALPSSFVDARKAQGKPSKDVPTFRTKVISQLALEVANSAFGKSPIKKKLANGGDAGTDTVPALLTPGEFVINKDAARRIGQANLDSMNKRGVARFAKGGSVGGVKRFHEGGGVGSNLSSQNNLNTFDMSAAKAEVEAAFRELGLSGQKLTDAVDLAAVNMNNGASAVQAFAEEQKKFKADQLQDDTAVSMGGMGNPANQARRADQTEKSKTDAVLRKKLADRQELLIKSFGRQIKQANAGISKEEALSRAREVVRNQYGELASSIQESIDSDAKLRQEKEKQKREKETKSQLEGIESNKESTMKGLDQIQGIASSAQQFVFAGAAAAALATQFTGLSQATKTAITETVGYATALIGGIGTIADLVVSITKSVVARSAEAAASKVVTEAKLKEAAASGVSIKNLSESNKRLFAFAGVVSAVAGVFVVVSTTVKYFTASLRAEAKELGKISEAFIARLEQGENVGAGLASNEKRRVGTEIEARTGEEQGFIVSIGGVVSAVVGGIAAFALGIATLPVLIGVAAVTIVAALGSWALGWKFSSDAAKEAQDANTQAMEKSIMAFSALTARSANLKRAIDQINATEGLTDEQTLNRITEEQASRSQLSDEARIETGTARKELRGFARGAGKSVSELSEEDFKGDETSLRIFNFSKKVLEKAGQEMQTQLSQSRQNISLARGGLADKGIDTFEGAMQDANYKRAFNETKELITRDAGNRQRGIIDELDTARKSLFTEENKDAKDQIRIRGEIGRLEGDLLSSEKGERKLIADLELGQRNIFESNREASDAQRAAALASQKAAERLEVVADFNNSLSNFGKSIDAEGRKASDLASLASGGVQDFSIGEVTGLKDLQRTGDRAQFSRDLQRARDFLPTAALKKEADGIIESVELGADLLQKGLPAVTKLSGLDDLSKDQPGRFEEVLSAAGISADKAKADGFYDEMLAKFLLSFEDGISPKEFKEIFARYLTEAEVGAKQVQEMNGLMNKSINNQGKFVDALMAVNDKEIQARQTALETIQKGEEFRRRARGLEQTATSKGSDNLALSRNRLSGIGGKFAGQAQAGNLASIAGVRSRAQQELRNSRMTLEMLKANNASPDKLAAEEERQKQLQRTIKITTEELGHFASATEDAVNATLDRINEEKHARDVQKSVIEQAVVGGSEDRRQLARTMFNVQKAFATGTLQNQSPEDRSATVALLDKFDTVFLPGAGMTGGDLKELLIRQDARRMGLSEEAAMAIFDRTPVEEKLIQSIDHLANVMDNVAAAQSQAGFAAGGPVYKNEGGTIFQPKGTDTVPAMLTPGEFVIRKSAVDKVGVGALHAINQGQPLYRANGGPIYRPHGSSHPEREGDGVPSSTAGLNSGSWDGTYDVGWLKEVFTNPGKAISDASDAYTKSLTTNDGVARGEPNPLLNTPASMGQEYVDKIAKQDAEAEFYGGYGIASQINELEARRQVLNSAYEKESKNLKNKLPGSDFSASRKTASDNARWRVSVIENETEAIIKQINDLKNWRNKSNKEEKREEHNVRSDVEKAAKYMSARDIKAGASKRGITLEDYAKVLVEKQGKSRSMDQGGAGSKELFDANRMAVGMAKGTKDGSLDSSYLVIEDLIRSNISQAKKAVKDNNTLSGMALTSLHSTTKCLQPLQIRHDGWCG